MLRITLSPTGDMHLNSMRTALLNYVYALEMDEDLIVRIEDTNKERNIEAKDAELVALLDLFGIKYSQIIYESKNYRFHSVMALDLLHRKKAFNCFCSQETIKQKKTEAKQTNKPYQYDDTCKKLPAELVIDNENKFSVRINRPDQDITIKDHIDGEIVFDSDTIDSFIILNQDKTSTPDFASAIDDMLNDISFVIQEEKYLNNTPKHKHIRNSLGYDKEIKYLHIPSIVDGDTISIKSLLEDGYLPEAISNYLISTVLESSKDSFKLKNISKSPVSFSLEKLREINRESLKNLENKELSTYVGFADEEIGKLAKIYLKEACTTKELKAKIAPVFEPRAIPEEFADEIEQIKKAIDSAPFFNDYNEFKNYILDMTGLSESRFIKLFSILLTNNENSTEDIEELYNALKNYLGEIIK